MKVARHVRRLERERTPQLVEGAVERTSRRQDADDRMWLLVEQDRPIEDRGIRAELTDPQRVAQNRDAILSGLILVGQKRSAAFRLDAEDVEVVCRDARAAELDRIACARERRGTASLRSDE